MTREEAIKVVRNIYQTDSEKEALETLIPELKESDDEKIIKKLQDYVKNRNWMLNGPTQAEVLAWLEKQKNLISYYEEKLDRCACENLDKGIKEVLNHPEEYGLEKQKEQKHPNGCFTCDEYKKGYEEGRRNGFTAGYNKAMKEVEQKEQEPIDANHIVNAILSALSSGLETDEILKARGFTYDDVEKWLENRFKFLSLQPKQEVTDEEIEKMVIRRSRSSGTTKSEIVFYRNGIKDAIKCFGLRPSWKPSKDEERLINTAISFLKDFADKGYENAVECIDWLKSKLNGNSCK